MADNNFKQTVEALLNGMDGFISSKTVVGEPIHVGETIILPLIDVTFGCGAGAFNGKNKNNGAGGIGGKISPSCALVIQGDKIRLVNIKNQDGLTKILDLVPDIVDKFSGKETPETPEKAAARETLASKIKKAAASDVDEDEGWLDE